MAGMFDDLIPQQGAAAAPAQANVPSQPPSGGGMFDDLIPQSQVAQGTEGRLRVYIGDRGQPSQQQPEQQPTLGDYATDFAKSVGIGGVKGAIGLAGLPADATDLATKGLDYVAGTNTNQAVSPFVNTLGSQAIQNAVESQTEPFYQPKYLPGQFGQAIGEFGSAALGGPASIPMRIAARVVAPALASEGAGQLADKFAPEAAPFARIAGAIGGAGLASGLANAGVKAALTKSPTEAALEASKNSLYASPEIAAVQFRPAAMQAFSSATDRMLLANKVDKTLAPTVGKIVDGLSTPRFGANGTVADFDLARQSLSSVPFEEKRAAGIVRQAIDNYLGRVPQSHLLAGNARAANTKLLQARSETAALKRSQEITSALGRAENQAGATYSGQNLENATRQQLKPILNEKQGVSKNKSVFKDYTPAEVKALKAAVNGSFLGNRVRDIGKLLGSGHGVGGSLLALEAANEAHHEGHDWGTSIAIGLGVAAAGRATSKFGAQIETKRAKEIGELLRSRSPSGAVGAARNRGLLEKYGSTQSLPATAYQGLLAGLPAIRAAVGR